MNRKDTLTFRQRPQALTRGGAPKIIRTFEGDLGLVVRVRALRCLYCARAIDRSLGRVERETDVGLGRE